MHDLMRTVERLIDNDWYVCRLSELNKGDVFRMHEPTGELVGGQNWIAESEPNPDYSNDGEPVWGIRAKGENDND